MTISYCALFPRVGQPTRTEFLVEYRLERRSLLREEARVGSKGHIKHLLGEHQDVGSNPICDGFDW